MERVRVERAGIISMVTLLVACCVAQLLSNLLADIISSLSAKKVVQGKGRVSGRLSHWTLERHLYTREVPFLSVPAKTLGVRSPCTFFACPWLHYKRHRLRSEALLVSTLSKEITTIPYHHKHIVLVLVSGLGGYHFSASFLQPRAKKRRNRNTYAQS